MSKTTSAHDHKTVKKTSASTGSLDDKSTNVNVTTGQKVASEVVRHIFDNVINRKDIHVEGPNLQERPEKIENLKSRCKGDTNTPTSSLNSFDLPNPTVKEHLDSLVTNIKEINDELQNICGEKSGISTFIDKQEEFTKEILDAYITSEISEELTTGILEQRRASTDVTKPPHGSQMLITADEILEYYPDEKILNVTSFDVAKTPETMPLPYDSDEDLKEPPNSITTEALIHTPITETPKKITPNPSDKYVHIPMTEEIITSDVVAKPDKKKKKKPLRTRFWNFFLRNTSDASRSTRLQHKN